VRREAVHLRLDERWAVAGAGAQARVLDYWVAAVPTWWNIVPNGHDAITGMVVAPSESIIHTVVPRVTLVDRDGLTPLSTSRVLLLPRAGVGPALSSAAS